MKTKDVAKILNVSIDRVKALIYQGKITAHKNGRDWNIRDYSKAVERINGRPRKIPKVCYLVIAITPAFAYGYYLLFKFQGF